MAGMPYLLAMRPNHPLSRIANQVMWDRLISVVEEQAQTLVRTAFGTATREAGDLSAGVYDTQGRMLAQAVTGTPGHVNSMAVSVSHVLNKIPLKDMADAAAFATTDHGALVHRLYLEFASFTSAYLEHQDVEERVVMPALEAAIGFDAVLAIHQAILGSIPPEKMATSLSMMPRGLDMPA